MSEDLFTGEIELIAIVGMACRFPGASGIERYWQNLRDGVESITVFRDEELLVAGVEPATVAHPRYVKARGRLEEHDFFDAAFFGFTPSEAAVTDPQHRLFLECAWEAMEHAGYDPRQSGEGTGVFAGAGLNTYALRNLMADPDILSKEGEYRILIGNDKDFVATRTSYKLDLKGPSLNISTACSTSLVAVHYACNGLLAYQCDMALAGAVSIYTPQDQGYMHEPGGILSADGHCRPFSADAGGTVGSAGVGIVILKRLADALADGDTIHAVVRGTAVNNDGADKIGFTAPSVEGQARVIVEAQEMAGVSPESIGFIEAHGTGTPLGDPIELAALSKAFSRGNTESGSCYLGSVKSNFGHCDTAAGMAGLIKAVLALKHQAIPPTLHCGTTHPEIDFANSPFQVNTELQRWEDGATPRRAGVSSFGVGGTNAHVILEEAPPVVPSSTSRTWHLLTLSAKSGSALDATRQRLAEFIAANPLENLDDVAYTLQVGRSHFNYKRAIVCHDRESAIAVLQNTESPVAESCNVDTDGHRIAFLFSGQGTQYIGMGKDLYRTEPRFRAEVDRCAEILVPLMGRDIRHILFAEDMQIAEAEQILQETSLAQPALFVVEYSLARLMISIGVIPEACIGHSLGEYVAACIAGVFSLEDALRIIVCRGRLMQEMFKGAMIAVSATPEELSAECLEDVSVAAVNTTRSCVLSGTFSQIEEVEGRLAGAGIPTKRLHTSHAFHSEMMRPVIGRFIIEFETLKLSPPAIKIISNVTGNWLSDEQATDPCYWGEHLLSTVRFADGITTLFSEEPYLSVEIGPGNTLASFVRSHVLCPSEHVVCSTLPHARTADGDNCVTFARCLAKLWESTVQVDWNALHEGEKRQRIPLPTYPFERQRYFLKPLAGNSLSGGARRAQLRQDSADWFYRPSWKRGVLPLQREGDERIKHWLIFTDNLGIGRDLGKTLQDDGATVECVVAADSVQHDTDDGYSIDPCDTSAYLSLIQRLDDDGKFPDGIVYCWSLTGQSQKMPNTISAGRMIYYDSLILLIQALEQCKPGQPNLITVVASGMFEVIGNEQIDPAVSLLMGPVTVIPQEHPHISCKVVDITDSGGIEKSDSAIPVSLAAVCKSRSLEPVIALRGTYCWERIFEPVSLPAVTGLPSVVRQGGVYLIAGGMGGIGLELAEYFAQSAGARLILVGRNILPARECISYQKERIAPAEKQQWLQVDGEREKIERVCAIKSIRNRGSLEPGLNSLCAALVIRYLNRSDINTRPGRSYTLTSLEKQLDISPKFTRFFSFLLSTLSEDGHARLQDGSITFLGSVEELEDPIFSVASLIEEFQAFAPMIQFLEHCADNYPRALTSEKEAISVLYPQGDSTVLKKIADEIEEHTFHRVYCLLLAEKVKRLVDAAKGRCIRILEIGGGAGILTKHVMPLISGKNVEYTFTDIGPSFVAEARGWAAQNGYHDMRFGTLDVGRDFSAQGYKAESFDMIIELDVVHATPRIISTLGNLRRLLVPEGMLLMAESTSTPRWTTMIYGLAEGWWLYEDTDLRPEGPLLKADRWETTLSKVGFDNVHAYPLNGAKRVEHDCCLVVGMEPKHTVTGNVSGSPAEVLSKRMSRLEEMGAEVRTYAADISDPEQMEAVINGVEAEFGNIHGVIHSAAVENRGAIQLKEVGAEGPEFAAKVNGSIVLDELFKTRSLDFMVICSSITSILGGVGDVEYTAVNAFADAFASAKAKNTDRYTVAIDWDRWIGTGMAASFEKRFLSLSGSKPMGGMSAEEGMDAFARILDNPYSGQIVVSTRPFNDWISEARAGTSANIADRVPGPVSMQSRPVLNSAYTAPISDTQKTIVAVWQDVLGIERIGLDDVFSEIGGDSLIAIKVVARLSEAFEANITVRALFEDQTVARLSERIEAMRSLVSDENILSDDDFDMDDTGTL